MRIHPSLVLALAAALSGTALAQAPTLTVQGELSNERGEPLTARYTLNFRLYERAAGGDVLWEESGDVDVSRGRFTATLGLDAVLDPTLFDGSSGAQARYLAFVLPSGVELSPRVRVGAAALVTQAATAGETHALAGQKAADFATKDHDHDATYLGQAEGDAAYSPLQHAHDGRYSRPDHRHDGTYAPVEHRHEGLYAPLGHNHDQLHAKRGHAHAEYAPAVHDHDALYLRKTESDSLFAGTSHGHADRYLTKEEADGRYLTGAAGDARYYTRAASSALLSKGVAYSRTEADGRFLRASDAAGQFLATESADARYAPVAGPSGDFSVGGPLAVGPVIQIGGVALSQAEAKRLVGGQNADGLHGHDLKIADTWCPGFMANGICVADYRKTHDSGFLTASHACARLGADIASDAQMHALRYSGTILNSFQFDWQAGNVYWTNSFADSDPGSWSEANGGAGNNHDWNSAWAYACVYNITPPAITSDERNVEGVRLTYLHNMNDTDFRGANRACHQRRSDLCSDAEYGILREKGLVTVGMWSSSHSDNDSSYWSAFSGSYWDDPSIGNLMGFACCATSRPLDLSCPGELINGVCATKIVNDARDHKKFLDAAKDCAATKRSHLCSMSHSAVLRSAGRLTASANWTESHSDNDGGNAWPAVGTGMPDDPHPDSKYGYACCL